MERTFIILKPDALQRGLAGQIISRIEQRGLRILAMKMMSISSSLAEQHYVEHKHKPFYKSTLQFITASPVVVMVVEGPQAVTVMRTMIGATDSRQAVAGTIRGDFGLSPLFNLIHSSDTPKSAEREIELFFESTEIHSYDRSIDRWITLDI